MVGFGCLLGKEGREFVQKQLLRIVGEGNGWYDRVIAGVRGEEGKQEVIQGFVMDKGGREMERDRKEEFVITGEFVEHVRDVLRAVGGGSQLPVLMEGPTACGKTAVVKYLAERLGFELVRVNNH